MHLRYNFLLLFFLFLAGNVGAQVTKNIIVKNPLGITSFIENKGQWSKINNKIPILFQTEQEDQFISLTQDGFYWEAYFRKLKEKSKIEQLFESEVESENEEKSKFDYTHKFIQFKLLNCNKNPKIIKLNKTDFYFSYGDKELTTLGYHKIIYKDIYPNIDWIIQIDSIYGNIKYSFDLHQNSDVNNIQIQYLSNDNKTPQLIENKLYIENFPFVLQESGLSAFKTENNATQINYKIKKNKISFLIPNYKMGEPIFIDPWVQKVYLPEDDSFYTSAWYKLNKYYTSSPFRLAKNIPVKVNYDYNGNSFIYGGPLYPSQPKIAKYNSNGKKQWMFMGSVPSVNFKYVDQALSFMGTIYCQKSTGKIFTCNGYHDSGTFTIRLDDSGHYDNFKTKRNLLINENSDIQINCQNYMLYIAAGGTYSSSNYTYSCVDSNNTLPNVIFGKNLRGNQSAGQDIVELIVDDSGYSYYLITGSYVTINANPNGNKILKVSPNHTLIWEKPCGFSSTTETSNHPNRKAFGMGISNSANVLSLNKNYLFYYDGKFLAAYNKITGKFVGNVDSSSKKIPLDIQGIAADDCNNIYVGGDSATIRIYNFNGTNFKLLKVLNPLNSTSKQQVNDVRINVTNGLIFYCGDSLLGIATNPYQCIDSSYISHIPNKQLNYCQNQPLIASITFPDTSEIYTFQWTDSVKNEMVRNVSIRHKFSDTFSKPEPNKTYKVNITKSKSTFCGGNYSQLTFKILPPNFASLFDTLCQGQSFTKRKRNFTSDITFTDTLRNMFGCDSFMTYKLHFHKKSFYSQNVLICRGDKLFVGTKAYTNTGSYTDTLTNAVGCDSVVSTKLTLNFDSMSQNVHVCNTYFYKIGNQSYYKPGTYIAKFKNRFGCDSIIRTVLTMASDTIIRPKKTLCSSETYKVGIHTYNKSGVYRDTFKRFNGCDSFVQSTLKFISDTTIHNNVSLCQGDSLKVGKHIYKITDNYIDSLKKYQGCDSIIKTSLTVHPKYNQTKFIHLCPKESIIINGKTYSQSQTFKYTYKTDNKCDSVVEFTIVKSDLESIFTIDSTQNPSMTFRNISKKDVKFYWRFDNATDSTHRNLTKNYQNDSSKKYQICLIVKDSFSCVDTVCQSFNLTKLAYMIFNSFTPNNDGYNDIFKIKSIGGTFNYDIQVFNRWGAKVFEQIHASSSDQTKLWNGLVMNIGAECPSGSYFAIFQIYLKGSNNPPEVVHGVITLIR